MKGGPETDTSDLPDTYGKITSQTVDGQLLATPTYSSVQELASVTYAGGSKLNSITRDGAGRVTGQEWTFPSAATITDTAARSQAGRMVQETLTRGSTSYASTYKYDAAGRLVSAAIPGHTLTYGFAGSGGCGVNAAAGASGNRTSLTDVWTAPGQAAVTTSTSYCYDWADRLTSSLVTGAVPGANSVAAGVAASNIVYDVQGNVVRLADMLFSYDAAGLHAGTTYDDGSTVSEVRDASGRVVARTVDPAGSAPAVTTKLLYAGEGDGAWAQVSGSTLTRQVGLPGGVTCTLTGSTKTFDYPSLLGHTLTTGDGTTTAAGVRLFDPYGQPLDPVTLAIGTTTADDQTSAQANSGWYGGALKLTETAGSTAVIEMGARLYVPALGRFLEVDPIGNEDLSGKCVLIWCDWGEFADDASFVLGIAGMFGCAVCLGLSIGITVVRTAYKATHNDLGGAALGVVDLATAGVGKIATRLVDRAAGKAFKVHEAHKPGGEDESGEKAARRDARAVHAADWGQVKGLLNHIKVIASVYSAGTTITYGINRAKTIGGRVFL